MVSPVPTSVAPQDPEYHTHDAPTANAPPVMVSMAVSPAQIEGGVELALVATVLAELIVKVAEAPSLSQLNADWVA